MSVFQIIIQKVESISEKYRNKLLEQIPLLRKQGKTDEQIREYLKSQFRDDVTLKNEIEEAISSSLPSSSSGLSQSYLLSQRRSALLYHKSTELVFQAEREQDIVRASELFQQSILTELEGDKREPDPKRKHKDYDYIFDRYTVALKKAKCFSAGLWACKEYFSDKNSFHNSTNPTSDVNKIQKRLKYFEQKVSFSDSHDLVKEGWLLEAREQVSVYSKKADSITWSQFSDSEHNIEWIWVLDQSIDDHCEDCIRNSKLSARSFEQWSIIGVPGSDKTKCGSYCRCGLKNIKEIRL
jgi:hypothetical protein